MDFLLCSQHCILKYNWCFIGSFDTFLWSHPALVSVRKTAAQPHSASCNVLLNDMKTRKETVTFFLSPLTSHSLPNFASSISSPETSFQLKGLSGRTVFLLYTLLLSVYVCARVRKRHFQNLFSVANKSLDADSLLFYEAGVHPIFLVSA